MFISSLNDNMYNLLVKMERFYELIINLICLFMFFNIKDRRDSIVANMWIIHFIKRVQYS